MDLEYVGIPGVIDGWGRLLKQTRDATLVGYFMNWSHHQAGGQLDEKITKELAKKLVNVGRVSEFHRTLYLYRLNFHYRPVRFPHLLLTLLAHQV